MKKNESDHLSCNNYKQNPTKHKIDILAEVVGLRLIVIIILTIIIGAILIAISFQKTNLSVYYYLLLETGKALFITALISGPVKWYMSKQYERLVDEQDNIAGVKLRAALEKLQEGISKQTDEIARQSSSISAINEAGVSKFYKNRNAASQDIKIALEDEKITSIKIIGISLNDFVRDEKKELHSAWNTIQEYIEHGRKIRNKKNVEEPNIQKLKVQILLIDPCSKGALLRAKKEITKKTDIERLSNDVGTSIKFFRELERSIEGNKERNVELEVRVYQAAPILYLVRTSSEAFVQTYYFRPTHETSVPVPVLRFSDKPKSDLEESSMHYELGFHFDSIWNNVSTPIKEYLEEYSQGVDLAIQNSGIKNIYYNPQLSRERIKWMIEDESNTTLWIKGISLHTFFQYGDLDDAIFKAIFVREKKLDIRILLINPTSEQARFRSFREYKMTHRKAQLDKFTKEQEKESRLCKDTERSKKRIADILIECKNKKKENFRAAQYNSAPEAFMIITDKSVLIEQYHYGKIGDGIEDDSLEKKILGGDVPVVEYTKFEKSEQGNKNPYEIFKDHFSFVFENCSEEIKIDNENTKKSETT